MKKKFTYIILFVICMLAIEGFSDKIYYAVHKEEIISQYEHTLLEESSYKNTDAIAVASLKIFDIEHITSEKKIYGFTLDGIYLDGKEMTGNYAEVILQFNEKSGEIKNFKIIDPSIEEPGVSTEKFNLKSKIKNGFMLKFKDGKPLMEKQFNKQLEIRLNNK